MNANYEWSLVAVLAAVAGTAYFKLATTAPVTAADGVIEDIAEETASISASPGESSYPRKVPPQSPVWQRFPGCCRATPYPDCCPFPDY